MLSSHSSLGRIEKSKNEICLYSQSFLVALWYVEVGGKRFFSDSDMFSWVELDPKLGIWAFSVIFVLFSEWQKI